MTARSERVYAELMKTNRQPVALDMLEGDLLACVDSLRTYAFGAECASDMYFGPGFVKRKLTISLEASSMLMVATSSGDLGAWKKLSFADAATLAGRIIDEIRGLGGGQVTADEVRDGCILSTAPVKTMYAMLLAGDMPLCRCTACGRGRIMASRSGVDSEAKFMLVCDVCANLHHHSVVGRKWLLELLATLMHKTGVDSAVYVGTYSKKRGFNIDEINFFDSEPQLPRSRREMTFTVFVKKHLADKLQLK